MQNQPGQGYSLQNLSRCAGAFRKARYALVTGSLLALLATGQGALAQPIGAGGQFQQIPPPPEQPKSIPDIRIEPGQGPTKPGQPGGAKVVVAALHVTGATKFSEAELIAVTGFRPGVELDLAGLRTMAARISDFYGRHGYFLAQAYLPAQDVANGVVTITVIEGRYGKVSLDNQSHVSDGLANSMLSGLDAGEVVETPPLERRLLLLSDLPGVKVNATLSPGESSGTSNLLVGLTPGRRVTGSLQVDNGGNYYTGYSGSPYSGSWRGDVTINFNEPFGLGDVASLRYLTSGSGLNYGRASYQLQITDLTVGAAYAHLYYRLGHEFKSLHANGTADVASVFASYPLIRSRSTNLRLVGNVDYRIFRDDIDATSSTSKRTAAVATIGLTGDHQDELLGGGWTSFSLLASFGDLSIKTPAVEAIDRLTAHTSGSYGILAFQLARLQAIAGPLSLYGEVRGQLASKNLDSSEKLGLGGAYGVRAYPEGEGYGDEGYILTLEARLRLATLTTPIGGELQTVAFIDHGSIWLNKNPWLAGDNHRSLSGAGAGLTWQGDDGFVVKTFYAFKLGNERATSAPDRSGRFYFQLTKFF